MYRKLLFDLSPRLAEIGVAGEYFIIRGLTNRDTDPDFELLRDHELRTIFCGLMPESVGADPIIAGYRELHRKMGCANRKNIPAPENLLKLVAKTGSIPHVNLLVDIYNLISVKTHLALGAHDIRNITGNVHLRQTDGTENFWPIGSSEPKAVKGSEYSYVDDANDVLCRLEVRQVEKTKVTPDTRDCFYIVQGNMATGTDYIVSAARDLIELTTRFCGGEAEILYTP